VYEELVYANSYFGGGMMRIRIIVPCYNEENRLVKTINEMVSYLDDINVKADILLVNDGSTDKTLNVIESLAIKYFNVHYLSYKPNRGKGYAVRAGMLTANGYDYLIFSDADGSSHLRYIIPYVLHSRNHNHSRDDIIITSRELDDSEVSDISFMRWLASRVYWITKSIVLQELHKDLQNGLKAYRGTIAAKIFSYARMDGFSFDVEVIKIAKIYGYKVKEVPVVWINTPDSRVSIIKDSFRMFFDLFLILYHYIVGDYTIKTKKNKK